LKYTYVVHVCRMHRIVLAFGNDELYFTITFLIVNWISPTSSTDLSSISFTWHMAVLLWFLWIMFSQNFKLFGFSILDFECTWWRLFQKRVVHTKFDIYVLITGKLCEWHISGLLSLSLLHSTWRRHVRIFCIFVPVQRSMFLWEYFGSQTLSKETREGLPYAMQRKYSSFQVDFANNFPLNNTSLLEIHICSTCMSNVSYCFSVWKWRIVFYYYLFDSKLNFSNLLHRFVEYFLCMAYGSPSLVSLDNVWDPKYSHRNIERNYNSTSEIDNSDT
jgi:hypothetical protein